MAEQTGIQWCDATFNPWVGCEKVSPGCARCYAENLVSGRMGRGGTWGRDGVRERTSDANWRKPLQWARLARDGRLPNGEPNVDGHRPRIFCASLADVFEERVGLDEWREDLFRLIADTPELDWLVLTKRPEHARDWLTEMYVADVCETGPETMPNVWLGVSIENARHTFRADVLREIPAAVRFISAEPLLGSLYTDRKGAPLSKLAPDNAFVEPLDLSGIDWVIVGGESGPGARPFHLEHAREIIDAALAQCGVCDRMQGRDGVAAASSAGQRTPLGPALCDRRTAVFVKQLGAKPIDKLNEFDPGIAVRLNDRKGGDWSEWPADLRIREFPRSAA